MDPKGAAFPQALRVKGLGFRVWGLGFRVLGLGFRVWGNLGWGGALGDCFNPAP